MTHLHRGRRRRARGLVAIVVSRAGTDERLHVVALYPPAGQTMSSARFTRPATFHITARPCARLGAKRVTGRA